VPVRGKNLVLSIDVPYPVGKFDRHTAGQRHITLAGEKALRSKVCGHERG
jgi:hypothetical protein